MRDKFLPLSPLFRGSKPFVSPPINITNIGRKFLPRVLISSVFSRFQNTLRGIWDGLLLPHHGPLELGMLNRKWLPLFLLRTRTKKCDRMAAAPPPHVKFRMDFSLSPFLSFDIDIPPHLSRIGLFLPALLFPSDSRLLAAAQRICCWRPHGELTRDQLGRSSLLPACLPTCATTLHSALTCQCCRCQCQRSTRSKLY